MSGKSEIERNADSAASGPGVMAAPANSEVLGLLGQILALNNQQRESLAKAWLALDPDNAEPMSAASQDGHSLGESAATVDQSVNSRLATISLWITEIETLPARERLEALEAAAGEEEDERCTELLAAEIAKLKNANVRLAIENALVKYSYEHPVLMVVLLGAIGVSLFNLGKALFEAIF